MLTPEERMDLRKKVLSGYQLSLDEAKSVIESLRQGAGVAVIAGESKKRAKKDSMTDEALDKDLEGLGL